MRARAGKLRIVTTDHCAPDHWRCPLPSGVILPDSDWVCRTASRGEEIFVYSIAD